MARLARIVVPGIPHHVTQRGNRRQEVFFSDTDYRQYLNFLTQYAGEAGTEIWAYCLMPNHVHLLLVPHDEAGLHKALQEAHRRYTRFINTRQDWKGYLWQGRFASCPMDEAHTLMAARYVELNPVRAGLVKRPQDWAWSSARGHLANKDDGVMRAEALGALVPNWKDFLAQGLTNDQADRLRAGERTGRPIGARQFIDALESRTGRQLHKGRPGRKSSIAKP
ncbi:MAG: transposase [Rhodospirillaceae bacterium]|jgi:putative transposase|nr:transposase [Rhodospirillaceae bacterium]MBT5522671.1 transposase [Rhodospirillaceae bacterium]MBT6987049.1 transposase [Rhodospirillaceae bacterium]MBT7287971.1 transposase [Rhodospirillaceae bacterium]MBT7664925.1 transposase [Rhodospirillaceae bacterium]